MAQKRAIFVDGAKRVDSCSKKQKSHDPSNELSSRLIELDVLVIKPIIETSVSQAAKVDSTDADSPNYSPNYSPEHVITTNGEIAQSSSQVTISPGFSPSIFLNDDDVNEITELLASNQSNGAAASTWKDVDDVHFSNDFGGVEKNNEVVGNPAIISIDVNSAPLVDSKANISTVEAVKLNLPTGWDDFSLIRKCNFLESFIANALSHFDTAFIYKTEQPLGEAIVQAISVGLIKSREELFITSNLWCSDAHGGLVLPALRRSLE
ncbi:Aldo/keto reductase [Corchorus olitorius]|uniref:Aldo/keto reductase n=1 Tax=Corchorus olitorius TaxID=93759 RepID=A0A1R3GA57_9ROSI|nr:Aldo/keto reductase [Corchorus olitorius]